jgi:signal transduction histidine kinase
VAERTGELSAKNLELAEKHRAMETLQRNKDEYFSIVTHDLKNPVNAIINLSRMMQMDYEDIPEELLNDIKIIESASTQMLNIVNNVNDFNKLQATEFKPRPVRMNVLQQVERIVAVYRLLAWPRGTEILLESNLSGAEEIIADPHSFEQIIGNILSNAVKFSPRNSRIRVLLRQEEGDVLISVLDQGEGIPRNILERISKQEEIPEDNDKYKVTGGLGLFIIRKLTNLLNGNLAFEVNSENGKETVVTVSFSLFTPDSEEEKTDD